MSDMVSTADVYLWGSLIGYVSWKQEDGFAFFEYDRKFLTANIEPSPLKMPVKSQVYSFRDLNTDTFKGLPGLLAESLPDKFGNALIDVWLSKQSRPKSSFNPVERLCYMGTRGMGALEFRPSVRSGPQGNTKINIGKMVDLASQVLTERENFKENSKLSISNLIAVGTSAGGARAKCVIALNEKTQEILSGQVSAPNCFTYWILKLDGVKDNKDKEKNDELGFGRLEYSYYLMAKDCGIEMMESRLWKENEGRHHFMTKRFDRLDNGEKLHMQSLSSIAHFDFNQAGSNSYEQALEVIRKIVTNNVLKALEQQFRRAVFNIIGRNQDDHTKNIAFLMNKKGEWSLSPAYDLTYSYNPDGHWTYLHQMSLNGKRDLFTVEDLIELGLKADLKRSKVVKIISEIKNIFLNWPKYAKKAGVYEKHLKERQKYLRTDI